MSDAKTSPHSKHPAALKLWTDRLRPAIGSALLDDLIRLIGEYCLSRLSWSPVLRSKRIAITDADAAGFGRSLSFFSEPPAGLTEAKAPHGWFVALSAEPLSELACGSSLFSWAVRVDEWAETMLTTGVASADANLLPSAFGVCEKAYGVYMASIGTLPAAVHKAARMRTGKWAPMESPEPLKGRAMQIRLTADLSANTVRVALEHVPCAVAGEGLWDEPVAPLKRIEHSSWVFSVPGLAHCHLHVAAGDAQRITLMP